MPSLIVHVSLIFLEPLDLQIQITVYRFIRISLYNICNLDSCSCQSECSIRPGSQRRMLCFLACWMPFVLLKQQQHQS